MMVKYLDEFSFAQEILDLVDRSFRARKQTDFQIISSSLRQALVEV